jgi:hypothetical protein
MKKFILILIASFVFAATAMAQPLEITQSDDVVKSDGKTDIYGKFILKNSSDAPVQVLGRLVLGGLYEGHSAAICIGGLCYADQTEDWTIVESFSLGGNSETTIEKEYITLYPWVFEDGEIKIIEGVSTVTVQFWVVGDEENSMVEFTTTFEIGTSSVEDEIAHGFEIKKIMPNPARDFVNIEFDTPDDWTDGFLEVYDAEGNLVQSNPLCDCTERKMSIDVSKLGQGMYYCNLLVAGRKTKAKKLVVVR